MRILFLSTWFPYPPDNGSKIRVYHLLRALGERHELTLVAFAWDTERPEETPGLESVARVIAVARDPFQRSRMAHALRYLSLQPIVTRSLPEMRRAVAEALAGERYDAVIASTEVTAVYALEAARIPVRVLEEHNSMSRWMGERYAAARSPLARANHWVSLQKTRAYEARLFRRFDLVTMVSGADAEISRALPGFAGRVEVVPNGVDCAHNVLGLAAPAPGALVFNGALSYSANYDAMRFFLAEIYPQIRAELPEATLAITGSTKGVALGGLALDESVRLTGWVEDVRLPVAQSSACVVPLREGGGTRLKILEAMALGTPVVATTKGAEGLNVVSGEHLLIADAPGDFAAAALRLLRDGELRARLARNARRLVEERYDWAQIGARFAGLVEEAAHGRAGAGLSGVI